MALAAAEWRADVVVDGSHTVSSSRWTLRNGVVRVLEADPDLGAALSREHVEAATRASVAPLFTHERGPWQFFPEPDAASFGALVLDGLIVVRLEIDGRGHIELLGEGDVMSPWSGAGPELAPPSVVSANVVSDVRMAF